MVICTGEGWGWSTLRAIVLTTYTKWTGALLGQKIKIVEKCIDFIMSSYLTTVILFRYLHFDHHTPACQKRMSYMEKSAKITPSLTVNTYTARPVWVDL